MRTSRKNLFANSGEIKDEKSDSKYLTERSKANRNLMIQR